MAKAGLLDEKKATIHWENQDSFAEEFLEVELTKQFLYAMVIAIHCRWNILHRSST